MSIQQEWIVDVATNYTLLVLRHFVKLVYDRDAFALTTLSRLDDPHVAFHGLLVLRIADQLLGSSGMRFKGLFKLGPFVRQDV